VGIAIHSPAKILNTPVTLLLLLTMIDDAETMTIWWWQGRL